MKRRHLGFAAALLAFMGSAGSVPAMATSAPEFPHQAATDWINSAPLTLASLRGSVVLVEFWTFDCYNCRNTLPWLKSIDAEYGAHGLKVVSVHTPELEQERNPANVRAAVKELGITWPVMIDGDYSYWRSMRNRYWPAFYLIDRQGNIVLGAFGELHRGEKRGDEVEARIRDLMARAAE